MDVRVVTCWLSRISSITAAIGDELFVFSRLEQRDQCHQMNVNYAVCSIDLWFLLQSSRKLATLHWIARNTHLLRKALMPDSLCQPLHSTWGGRGRNGIRPQWWNPIPIFHSVPLRFVRTSRAQVFSSSWHEQQLEQQVFLVQYECLRAHWHRTNWYNSISYRTMVVYECICGSIGGSRILRYHKQVIKQTNIIFLLTCI